MEDTPFPKAAFKRLLESLILIPRRREGALGLLIGLLGRNDTVMYLLVRHADSLPTLPELVDDGFILLFDAVNRLPLANGNALRCDLGSLYRECLHVLSLSGPLLLGHLELLNTQVASCFATLRDGQILLDADAETDGIILEKCRVDAIVGADIHYDSPKPQCKSEYIICYPSGSETLWDISKKYEISREELKKANNLESENISGRKTIIIPCFGA